MVDPGILAFVKQKLAAGETRDNLRASGLQQGWTKQDMDEIFAAVDANTPAVPIPPSTHPFTPPAPPPSPVLQPQPVPVYTVPQPVVPQPVSTPQPAYAPPAPPRPPVQPVAPPVAPRPIPPPPPMPVTAPPPVPMQPIARPVPPPIPPPPPAARYNPQVQYAPPVQYTPPARYNPPAPAANQSVLASAPKRSVSLVVIALVIILPVAAAAAGYVLYPYYTPYIGLNDAPAQQAQTPAETATQPTNPAPVAAATTTAAPATSSSNTSSQAASFAASFVAHAPVQKIEIDAYGTFPAQSVTHLAQAIAAATGAKTSVGIQSSGAIATAAGIYDAQRKQADAQLLGQYFESLFAGQPTTRHVVLVDGDLFDASSSQPFIFSRSVDGAGTVLLSTARLSSPAGDFDARLAKVALHALGVSVGFGSSPSVADASCVMHAQTSAADLDAQGTSYCAPEQSVLSKAFTPSGS